MASSDAHTVKPWFAGLRFLPEVKDLAADGFRCSAGGSTLSAAAASAHRRVQAPLFTVNVFMWPSASPGDAAPHWLRAMATICSPGARRRRLLGRSDLGAGDSELQDLL